MTADQAAKTDNLETSDTWGKIRGCRINLLRAGDKKMKWGKVVFGKAGLCFVGLVSLLVLTTGFPSKAGASGFAVYTHGAKELALQNNAIAHSEGAASNYFNPALNTDLKGTQIEIGTTLIFPSSEFKGAPTGETEDTEDRLFYPSTLYATYQYGDRLAAGIGIFNPFGLGTDWGDTWEGRYAATNSRLRSYNINPNIAWKISDKLSVGGGLDLLLADAVLEKNLDFSSLPDGEQKFEGDGEGFGFNLGIAYRPTEDWSFGASYRSKIDLDIDGKAKFKLPAGTPAIVEAGFPDTKGSVEVNLPPQLFVGACYKGIDKLTVELGVRWEGWSTYEDLTFKLDQPVGFPTADTREVQEKDWDDTWSYSIGSKYAINDTLALLAGFRHDANPVPNETFEPAVMGSDKNSYSIGASKVFGSHCVAVDYSYETYENRSKNNNVGDEAGNGRYSTDVHMVAVSVSYGF